MCFCVCGHKAINKPTNHTFLFPLFFFSVIPSDVSPVAAGWRVSPASGQGSDVRVFSHRTHRRQQRHSSPALHHHHHQQQSAAQQHWGRGRNYCLLTWLTLSLLVRMLYEMWKKKIYEKKYYMHR
jgi:hypothetical protein